MAGVFPSQQYNINPVNYDSNSTSQPLLNQYNNNLGTNQALQYNISAPPQPVTQIADNSDFQKPVVVTPENYAQNPIQPINPYVIPTAVPAVSPDIPTAVPASMNMPPDFRLYGVNNNQNNIPIPSGNNNLAQFAVAGPAPAPNWSTTDYECAGLAPEDRNLYLNLRCASSWTVILPFLSIFDMISSCMTTFALDEPILYVYAIAPVLTVIFACMWRFAYLIIPMFITCAALAYRVVLLFVNEQGIVSLQSLIIEPILIWGMISLYMKRNQLNPSMKKRLTEIGRQVANNRRFYGLSSRRHSY